MSAPPGTRLLFSTARICTDAALERDFAALKAALDGDLVLVDKRGNEVVRRPCMALASGGFGPLRPATPLDILIDPDQLATVQLPVGLTVIFDAALEPPQDPAPFLEPFVYPIWSKGTGAPVPFTLDRAFA